jgi:hypothetical protein
MLSADFLTTSVSICWLTISFIATEDISRPYSFKDSLTKIKNAFVETERLIDIVALRDAKLPNTYH